MSQDHDFLKARFHERLPSTRRMWWLGAATGTGLWIWDLAIDPIGARRTAALRLLFCVIYLVPVIYTSWPKALALYTRLFTLAVLPASAITFFGITTQLEEGMVYGIGGYMFLQLGGYLLLQSLSFSEIVLIHVLVALIPHLMALLFPQTGFLHLQYSVLIWPATLMSILAQYHTYQDYQHSYSLQKQLLELCRIDPLTGVQNRRSFQYAAAQAVQTAQDEQKSLSVLMIDADHFKRINDLYGHLAGDKVLQELASLIRATLRKTDLVCRWGGEEFIAVLPETNSAEAIHLAERILNAVSKAQVEVGDGDICQLTVSIGVSSVDGKNTDLNTLLTHADQALYRAKSQGRNQIQLA